MITVLLIILLLLVPIKDFWKSANI